MIYSKTKDKTSTNKLSNRKYSLRTNFAPSEVENIFEEETISTAQFNSENLTPHHEIDIRIPEKVKTQNDIYNDKLSEITSKYEKHKLEGNFIINKYKEMFLKYNT
jgi:hypothetical protein